MASLPSPRRAAPPRPAPEPIVIVKAGRRSSAVEALQARVLDSVARDHEARVKSTARLDGGVDLEVFGVPLGEEMAAVRRAVRSCAVVADELVRANERDLTTVDLVYTIYPRRPWTATLAACMCAVAAVCAFVHSAQLGAA